MGNAGECETTFRRIFPSRQYSVESSAHMKLLALDRYRDSTSFAAESVCVCVLADMIDTGKVTHTYLMASISPVN